MSKQSTGLVAILAAVALFAGVFFISGNSERVGGLNVGSQTAAVADFNSSLIGHYPLDATSATTIPDASGNNNTGTSSNTSPIIEAGKIGVGSLSFNGTTDYVALGDLTGVDNVNTITVSAWVKSPRTTGAMYILAKETSSTESWSLYWSPGSGGHYGFNMFTTGGGATARTALGVTPDNRWHHIVGVYDGNMNSVKLYYDGIAQNTQPQLSGNIRDTSLGVCVGTWSGGGGTCIPNSGAWQGSMDDVRIYNQALNATQVGELFSLGGVDLPQPGSPSVAITSPANNARFRPATVSISANATALSGKTIAGVQFQVDNVNVGAEDTTSPYTGTWNANGLTGSHTITAIARDSAGLFGNSTIVIDLDNTAIPPVVYQPTPVRTINWTAPVGIPEPPFGIREDVSHLILRDGETCDSHPNKCYDYGSGVEPYHLNPNGEPYTHYVDNTNPDAILNNFDPSPLGTPERPIKRLPQLIPAGSIVEVHGIYAESHTSYNARFMGTSDRPAYIRSSICNQQNVCNLADRAKVNGSWDITGSYGIVENFFFTDTDGDYSGGETGMLGVSAPSDHISIRHNEMRGNLQNGQMGAAGYSYAPSTPMNPSAYVSNPAAIPENVVMLTNNEYDVFYKNTVHHGGNTFAPTDSPADGADRGGIFLSGRHMWALDNTCYSNGSTCVRTGGYIPNQAHISMAAIQHIYIGRNRAWDNREANYWTKQAYHVVFSENISGASYQAQGPDGKGGGMGFQYGPEDVWFINNVLYDTRTGISTGSDDNYIHQNAYFIGNVLYNIHKGDGDGGTPQGAINLGSGLDNYIVNNTIYDVDTGVYILNSRNNYISGNIISNIRNVSSNFFGHLVLQDNVLGSTPRLTNNIFHQPGGAAKVAFPTSNGYANFNTIGVSGGNIEADPQFVNASTQNFQVQANSPAHDAGNTALYEMLANRYQSIYGVSIRKDIIGNNRANGAAIDIGAYESGGAAIPSTYSLSVSVSGLGAGVVRANQDLINCGTNATVCSYNGTSTLSLSATPLSNSTFNTWGGACSGTASSAPCVVTLNTNKSVTANFVVNSPSNIDEFPPVFLGFQASTKTNAASIKVNTDEAATSTLHYGLTNAFGNITPRISSVGTTTTFSITSLQPNTTYHYRVVATDASGNVATSTTRTFVTLSGTTTPVDNIPPTITITSPRTPVVTLVGKIGFSLAADASDNVGVVGVRFYIDGVRGTEITQFPYGVGYYTLGSHTVFAVARDLAGNQATSTTVSFRIERATTTATTTVPVTPPIGIDAGGGTVVVRRGTTTPIVPIPSPLTVTSKILPVLAPTLIPVRKTLVKGSIGTDVLSLQTILASQGLLNTYVKGVFGTSTEAAVKAFQKKYNIISSGTPVSTGYGAVGPRTRTKLNSLIPTVRPIVVPKPAVSAPATFNPRSPYQRTLSVGSIGSDVRQLQVFLNTRGYTIASGGIGSKGFETTYYGPATRAAIIKFQKANSIPATGIFDTATIKKIDSIMKY